MLRHTKPPSGLTDGQKKAYVLMASGENVFLTGEAGTGKSYVLQEFISAARKEGKNVLVCAPTGVAAINIGGVTIHRAFKIPISNLRPDTKVRATSAVSSSDIVVIDEISMCRMDVFAVVASILGNGRKARQLIVVGDFYQLAPVLSSREKDFFKELWGGLALKGKGTLSEPFAFLMKAWEDFRFEPICLTEQMRQRDDREFLDALNRVREGDHSALPWLMAHARKEIDPDAIFLCGRNDTVASKNAEQLEKIPAEPMGFTAKKTGDVKKSDVPVDEVITLKKGCRIMTVINDSVDGNYVNGSLGTVRDFIEDGVAVDFDNGKTNVIIRPHTWEVLDYLVTQTEIRQYRTVKSVDKDGKEKFTPWKDIEDGQVVPVGLFSPGGQELFRTRSRKVFSEVPCGTFTQLPVKLAYAVTIHKSQGQTFDSVTLDPRCFGAGQLYVALSRVRNISDLSFTEPVQDFYLRTSRAVKEFYRDLREKETERDSAEQGMLTLPPYKVSGDEMGMFKKWWEKILSCRIKKQKGAKKDG